jgi:hypothetical protein
VALGVLFEVTGKNPTTICLYVICVVEIKKRYSTICRRSFVPHPCFLQLQFKLLDSPFYTTRNIKKKVFYIKV